jgi:hypothetical protein
MLNRLDKVLVGVQEMDDPGLDWLVRILNSSFVITLADGLITVVMW